MQYEDDDEDDYALAAMGISDGYRPGMGGMDGGMAMTGNSTSQQFAPPPGRRTPPPRPSSTTKPKGLESFALRHDGGMGSLRRSSAMGSAANPALTRASSVSTEMGYVRAESPYQGPSGPSHPYQMYPQESRLARTASVATTSTVQVPDRPYTGPGGPTHPYGMYPQNIADAEVAESSMPAVPAVPVGFLGVNNHYQRRLGPDGEEIADLIGPDGHTEQLPPYTQYPEGAFARKSRPNVALPTAIAGAGGIGLATRNPEFSSQEDLRSLSPQSRMSTRSITSGDSNHQVNTAGMGASEKPKLKKWQEIARRKLCDIVPIWVIVLIAIVFILFGIVLGTVLAILKPKHPPPKHHYDDGEGNAQSVVVTTMTTTFDASPLTASPTNLPTLPTGTYALPISAPSAIQNSCLGNTQQSSAWSCQVPQTPYTITVTPIAGSTNKLRDNEVNLSLANGTFNDFFPYGTQPPILSQTQILNLVTDNQEPGRGPAWFFEMPYNKLVIVPQDQLQGSGSIHSKRDIYDERDHSVLDFTRKQVAQPGDNPWFCYWNGTLLEAFIYVNLTSSAGYQISTTSAGATATRSGPPSSPTGASGQPQWLPAYPKVLKIEERRIPGDQSITPYCIQQHIDYEGNASPVTNSTGQIVTIYLNETEASSISHINDKRSYDFAFQERDVDPGSCGCVWLWT